MPHTLLHLYNAAPPTAKSAARAAVAFLTGAALAVLATACSPAYAEPADRGTIAPRPRGPVLDTPLNQRLHPHRERGFFTPEFFRHGFANIGMVSGVGAHTRKDCGTTELVCLSPPPPVLPRQHASGSQVSLRSQDHVHYHGHPRRCIHARHGHP